VPLYGVSVAVFVFSPSLVHVYRNASTLKAQAELLLLDEIMKSGSHTGKSDFNGWVTDK
jgi:hypothetical protein